MIATNTGALRRPRSFLGDCAVDPIAIVRLYFASLDRCHGASLLGGQLERASAGLVGKRASERGNHLLERIGEISQFMRDLTPDELQALRLRYWARLTQQTDVTVRRQGVLIGVRRARLPGYGEIAEQLGCTPWAARELVASAASKVRAAAERLSEETHAA